MNPFSLSPAYAGLQNADYLFNDYRADWSGVDGGPVTYQMSYNTRLMEKIGVGGRFIFDKSDIFKQTLIMGTYSYEVQVMENHTLNFAISAGFYRNSIDLGRYFNDPEYVQDEVLINGLEKSKLKFASDLSALYRYGDVEAGILFSNLMFGSARYDNTELSYKPLKNYMIHASYDYAINETWQIKPVIMVRGGQSAPSYLEIAPQAKFNDRFWGTLMFRTGGIWGLGLGAEIVDGLLMNYCYNLSSGVALNTFGSHQIGIGVRLKGLPKFTKG
jgi:type IX secretion system PorP/SprF family membrane protein